MDLHGNKFGGGTKEVGGAVDLINQSKLCPHHEFFCKRSLPLSISETHYLRNVVGDTEIRKGEGMELDQLFHNTPYLRERNACIHPFDLDVLTEAFQMREIGPVDLPSAERGIPAAAMKLRSESTKDKEMRHKMHKDKNEENDLKKRKHCNKGSNEKDRKRTRTESGPGNLKRQNHKTA